MQNKFILAVVGGLILGLVGCSANPPANNGEAKAAYERQKNASDQSMRELDQRTR